MAQTQLATRIDVRTKTALERYCEATGLKMSRFIEDAILDKLEELEDAEDVKNLRREPTRALEDVLKELKLDGLL